MLGSGFRNEEAEGVILAYSQFLKLRLDNFSVLGAVRGEALNFCPQTPYLLQWHTLARFLRHWRGWDGSVSDVEIDREESYGDGTES